MKNTANNILCKNYTIFYNHLMGSHLKFHYEPFYFHQYFQYILELIYQLIYLSSYNFLIQIFSNITLIYHIHTHNNEDSK